MSDETEHLCACPDCGGIATAAVAEIQRLRFRLAKIAGAPVSPHNRIATTLKEWAMPHANEPENPMAGVVGALRSARELIALDRNSPVNAFLIAKHDAVLAQIDEVMK